MCNLAGALVNLNDFSNRPARVLEPEARLATGERRFRFVSTPHLPHGRDAGMLFEETGGTLFCSGLFHLVGRPEPLTSGDIPGRARQALASCQRSPFAGYVPYRDETGRQLYRLAELRPDTLAVMHVSRFQGGCAPALRGLAEVFRELLGEPAASAPAARG